MIKERLKKFYVEFISLKGSPEYISRSFAAGAFVGFCPFIGTHTVLCMAGSILFRLNLTAMYLATWVTCNPASAVLVLLGEYEVGRILLGLPAMALPQGRWTFSTFIHLGWGIILPMIVGWLILGPIAGVLFYPPTLALIRRVRRRKKAAAEPVLESGKGDREP